MAQNAVPQKIQGGCLCEKLRYEIAFPPDHDFVKMGSTCQCEQCRKQTGSLVFRVQCIPVSAMTWLFKSTLKYYYATPGIQRGFCSECGSFLLWKDEKQDVLDITVGTFDKSALKKYGVTLTQGKRHLWCEDEIPGITDHLAGDKWKTTCLGEKAERMQ